MVRGVTQLKYQDRTVVLEMKSTLMVAGMIPITVKLAGSEQLLFLAASCQEPTVHRGSTIYCISVFSDSI
jgi:hypothetical protein